MVFNNLKLLLRLLSQPADAMSGILDQGSLLFATVAVLAVSLLLQFNLPPVPQAPPSVQQTDAARPEPDAPVVRVTHASRPFSFYSPLLVLAIVYVPGLLLVTNLVARLGALGSVFERDYSSLLTCASMAWAAVHLPLALLAPILPLPALAAFAVAAYLYLAVLIFFAVRTVFGTENATTAVSV